MVIITLALLLILLVLITFKRKQGWLGLRLKTTFPKRKTLHGSLHELSSKEGGVLGISFHGKNTVLLSSFELMKGILGNQFLAGDRPFHGNSTQSDKPSPMGITWGSGQSWKSLKSHSKSHLRHLCSDNELMDSLIQKEIDKIISKVPTSDEMIPLDLQDLDLSSSCHRILWGILVGPREVEVSLKIQNILNHYKQSYEQISNSNDWYSYPSWLFYPKGQHQHNVLPQGYVQAVRQLVLETAEKNNHVDEGLINSLLRTLLSSGENASAADTKNYAVDQISNTVSDLCASGSQPMAHAIKWMIYLLAKNPQVQRRILQEITEEDANSVGNTSRTVYRRATLFEVFRVGNVLPIPIPRSATSTFSINGFVVHEGCSIICNLESVFKDRNYWGENVNAFLPERFLDPSGTKLVKTERMVVFGFGNRSCVGASLVWVTLMKYLTTICTTLELSQLPNGRQSIYAKARR